MEKNSSLMQSEDSGIIKWITVVAVAVPIVVAVLLFMPSKIDVASDWVYFLPHLNAVINTAATMALIVGLIFIKKGNIEFHRASMTTAFGLGGFSWFLM